MQAGRFCSRTLVLLAITATALLVALILASLMRIGPAFPLSPAVALAQTTSEMALASPHQTTAALASCSKTDCDNRNPYTTGCAGAGASYRVLAVAYLTDPNTGYQFGRLQLWWSISCQTNWARYVCTQASCPSLTYTLDSADGRQESVYGRGGVTPQLYLPSTKAQATAFLAGIPAFYAATGWY